MAGLTPLLIIEESVLTAMANNPNFIKEFGFLAGLKQIIKSRSSCNKCNGNIARRVMLVNAAKQSLTTMGNEKKRRLKELLKAEKVRIRVQANGKITEYTF